MATILTAGSGAWSAGGTWVGGVPPGTGDIAQIETTHTVTLTDNRQCFGIKFNGPGRTAFLIMNAGTILTFDDAVGAGWQDSAHDGSLTSNGTSGSHCKVQSAAAPPTNFWRGEGNNKRLVLRATYTDFVDMAGQFALDEGSVWTTIATNCTFKRSGAGGLVDWGLRNSTRFVNCTFDHCDVHPYLGADVAFLDNCSGINGTLFMTTNQGGGGMFASRTHNGVANDYRIYPNLLSTPSLSFIQAADRPVATDNVRIARDAYIGNAMWFLWDVSLIVNDLTLVSDNTEWFLGATYNPALTVASGVELVVRGTLSLTSNGGVHVPEARALGTGRLINHAVGGAAYTIRCGTATLKSALAEDFAAGNNVTVVYGKLIVDENAAHDNLTVENKATLSFATGGISWVVTSGKVVTINVGGTLTLAPATGVLAIRSSVAGSPFSLRVRRGKVLVGVKDRYYVDTVDISGTDNAMPVGNYAIQPIMFPAWTYKSGKSHVGYMSVGNSLAAAWGVMTLDHATSLWTGPHKLTAIDAPEGDGHKYASIIHTADGYLIAVYDAHNERFRVRKSNASNVVGDSSSWTQKTDIDTAATYPNLARGPDGTIYLMYRRAIGGSTASIVKSTDNGETFGAPIQLVNANPTYDFTYPFGIVVKQTGVIHAFGSFRNNAELFPMGGHNPWYMRSDDDGATWRKASGAAIAIPATPATVDTVYSGNAYEATGAVGKDGRPNMVYFRGDLAEGSVWHARWDGSSWVKTRISGAGQYADNGDIDMVIDASGRIHVVWNYGTAPENTITGEVTGDIFLKYSISDDNGATWRTYIIRKFLGLSDSPTRQVFLPLYMKVNYLADIDKVAILWASDPAPGNPAADGAIDVAYEIVSSPDGIGNFVAQNCSIMDANADDMVVTARNCANGGGNTNIVFQSTGGNTPHAGV